MQKRGVRIQKHFAELQAKVTTCHESITLAQHHPELLQVTCCQKNIYGRTKLLAGTGSQLPQRDRWGYKLSSSPFKPSLRVACHQFSHDVCSEFFFPYSILLKESMTKIVLIHPLNKHEQDRAC